MIGFIITITAMVLTIMGGLQHDLELMLLGIALGIFNELRQIKQQMRRNNRNENGTNWKF